MFEFKVHVHVHVRVVLYLRGYNKFEKNQQKNVFVTKNTYKSVRASTRARNYLLPRMRSRRILEKNPKTVFPSSSRRANAHICCLKSQVAAV